MHKILPWMSLVVIILILYYIAVREPFIAAASKPPKNILYPVNAIQAEQQDPML